MDNISLNRIVMVCGSTQHTIGGIWSSENFPKIKREEQQEEKYGQTMQSHQFSNHKLRTLMFKWPTLAAFECNQDSGQKQDFCVGLCVKHFHFTRTFLSGYSIFMVEPLALSRLLLYPYKNLVQVYKAYIVCIWYTTC